MNIQPEEFEIKLKNEMEFWIKDFETLREDILKSEDLKKCNYSHHHFDLEEQEEITVVYWNKKIISFSSLYCRKNYYPKNLSRVLNRTWKSPKIRGISQPYKKLAKYMLFHQLEKACELNKSAVFISIEGNKDRWIDKFIFEAKKDDKHWKSLKGFYKVTPYDNINSWQNILLFPLQKNYKLPFPFISKEKWHKRFSIKNF